MITNPNNVVRYQISGNTYSITYGYWDKSEIKVYLTQANGTVTPLTLNTDYTLTDPTGVNGTLTKVSDWGTATKITIMRTVSLTQEKDLVNGQVIDADKLEEALDHSMAAIQQLEEAQSRSLKFSVDEAGSNITFPNKAARQGSGSGTIMGFDSTGEAATVRDLAQFDLDVSNCHSDAQSATASKNAAAASETKAEKWAEETEDTPVETGKYSAKHYASKANAKATQAQNSANAASGYAGSALSAKNDAVSAKNDAVTAKNQAVSAKDDSVSAKNDSISAKNIAITARQNSEAWAVGEKDGVPVSSGDPQYNNNSKYYSQVSETHKNKAEKWAEEAEDTPVEAGKYSAKHYAEKASDSATEASGYAGNASNSANSASGSATSAASSKEDSEAWAVGKRNGVDVDPSDPAYHNNSKWWSEQAGGFEPITDQEIDDLFD